MPSRRQSHRCCGSSGCRATCHTGSRDCLHPPRVRPEGQAINKYRDQLVSAEVNVALYQRLVTTFTFFLAARPLLLENLLLLSMDAALRRGDLPLLPPSGLSIHQELFPVPSFCTRINRLCRDRLCLIEFYRRERERESECYIQSLPCSRKFPSDGKSAECKSSRQLFSIKAWSFLFTSSFFHSTFPSHTVDASFYDIQRRPADSFSWLSVILINKLDQILSNLSLWYVENNRRIASMFYCALWKHIFFVKIDFPYPNSVINGQSW